MGFTKDFKYNIGANIDNLIITNRKRKLNKRGVSQKYYDYTCKICKYNGEHYESDLKNGKRCPVCAGKKVLIGYNDLWTTHPEIAQLLKDPNDGYKYSKGSHKRTDFICPNCYKENKNKEIKNVVKNGLSCRYCSDSISIPEKFMINILEQMNVEYIYQLSRKTFDWIGNFRYDFYLIKDNTIIEVQGMQHACDTGNKKFGKFEEQVKRDNEKMELAMKNGITTYIQMDFTVSDYDYLYHSVMNSAFPILFDVKNIDFIKCFNDSLNSYVAVVCNLWNKGKTVGEIAKKTKLSMTTVLSYLKHGSKIELCDYSVSESNRRSSKLYNKSASLEKSHEINKKRVYCITTKEYFLSRKDALEKYPNAGSHISNCCNGKRKTSGTDKNGNKLKWRNWNEEENRIYEETGRLPQ